MSEWGRGRPDGFGCSEENVPFEYWTLVQYNLLYVVSFLQETHINIGSGKPYIPPRPSTETSPLLCPTKTFSTWWNCILVLAAHQAKALDAMDVSDPKEGTPAPFLNLHLPFLYSRPTWSGPVPIMSILGHLYFPPPNFLFIIWGCFLIIPNSLKVTYDSFYIILLSLPKPLSFLSLLGIYIKGLLLYVVYLVLNEDTLMSSHLSGFVPERMVVMTPGNDPGFRLVSDGCLRSFLGPFCCAMYLI